MATQIGTVKNLIGTVKAISSDGHERLLQIVDVVYPNERIITAETAAVELQFSDGSYSDLGRNSQLLLDPVVLQIDQTAAEDELQQIQTAILDGQDPTLTEEPAAAGPIENNGNEGTSITRVDHLAPETTPTSGFDTTGIAFSAVSDNEELGDRFQNDEPPIASNGLPTTSDNPIVSLDDDALPNGKANGIGDDTDGENQTGILAHNFGTDGAGNITLLSTGAPAGFSYSVSGNTLTITQGTTVVMSLEVNPTTGAYTIQQLAAIAHPEGDDENNQLFSINYTVTDGNGDTANGNIQINIDDDSPGDVVASPLTPLIEESFENLLTERNSGWDTFFTGGGTYIGDQGTEWNIGSNGIEAQKNLNSTLSASDGDVHLELDTNNNTQLSSTVELSASNATLSFDYKPRTGGSDSNMKVTLGGVEVNIDAPTTSTANVTAPNGVIVSQTLNASGWFSITLDFANLNTGSTTVTFEGTGNSNSLGALLDNISLTESVLQVDETDLSIDASHDFSSHFTGNYGADGLGDFVLNLNNTATGLTDTATGENIILSINQTNGAIEARTASSNDLVFTVTVDNAGVVTLDQQRAIEHPDNTQTNESISLPTGLIGLTVIDGDGDRATDQLDISSAISFRDDAPAITALAGSNDQDSFTANGDDYVTLVQSDPANRVVDHWQFRHDGGELIIDLNSERFHGDLDGDGDTTVFDSYIYLFTTDANGNIQTLIAQNDDDGFPHLDSKITINLPEGDYDLAVGAWPFSEAEARGDTHDRNMGTYNLSFGGDNDGVVLHSSPATGSVLESSTSIETTTATLTVDNHVDIDLGADEAGSSIDFTLDEVTIMGDLTSNGKAITFEARDTDSDGQKDQIVGSTEDGDVLAIEGILDSTSEVHLFAPVDSSNVGNDDIQITANVNITDGDGDTAMTTLNFNIDINQVIETPPSGSEIA